MNTTYAPFARPLYVMAKPVGALCNMACRYCYYLEKAGYYVNRPGPKVMSDALLECFIRQYIESQTMPQVLFTWHGGEPLLRPLAFYRQAMEWQAKYANGRQIDNVLQTNGTLLTDEWCRFLKENNWLVGISIDGPEEVHNAYRRMRGDNDSFSKVMRGIELLKKHGVEWNAMAVVNDLNSRAPLHFYRFFKKIGAQYLQFAPIVEQEEGRVAPYSVRSEAWGDFLCALFDEWVRHDVGTTFVQLFDATLANWVGEAPGVCTMAPVCGHASAIEHNGDVYSCDHFVYPEYRLGNIMEQTLTELMYSPRQQQFGEAKRSSLPGQCRQCAYLFACNGECPKNRILHTTDGEPGLNYLCRGYRQFFSHVTPAMEFMARELREGRAPANIMNYFV